MGGPGSGGFRGYGWPPGSADGPSQSSQSSTRPRKLPKPQRASKFKRYRKNRGKKATLREKALQEARRISAVREDHVNAFKRPQTWKKFRKSSKKKFVVFLHDTLPLWLRAKIIEFTECRGELVLLEVDKDPLLRCGEVKQSSHGGHPKKVKSPMAVPLKDLWLAPQW